jgi:PAS domain S-box-containing protein
VQSINAEGNYVFVNDEWKKVLGYTDQDLQNINMMNVIRNDQIQNCINVFQQVMEGKSIHDVETVFVAKNGSEIIVRGNACPIFKDGKFVSTVAFFEDITERKKIEVNLKESRDKLKMMNEKLGVVGSLTRHDVRNKLTAVAGNAYLLKKKYPDQEVIVDGLGKMEQAVKEIETIFDFAKMYEQIGVEELTCINVEKTLTEALALFSGCLNVKVINNCYGLTLLADSFLRQLFFNLIDNSLRHGKKVTTIKVSYEKTDQEGLRLIYEDDGVGVPVDNKLKLFKIGFSTGGSSGYGLYLIRRMIEVYGWVIEENGEPGIGAKFTITIPKINQNGKENFRIT